MNLRECEMAGFRDALSGRRRKGIDEFESRDHADAYDFGYTTGQEELQCRAEDEFGEHP